MEQNNTNIFLLIDELFLYQWQFRVLESLLEKRSINVRLAIYNCKLVGKSRIVDKLLMKFLQYDYSKYKSNDDSLEKVYIKKNNHTIRECVDIVELNEAKELSKHKVDFIVNFSKTLLNNELCVYASKGVLSCLIGRINKNYDIPDCLQEVMLRADEIESKVILTKKPKRSYILKASYGLTDKISSYRIQNKTYWKLASMIEDAVNQVVSNEELNIESTAFQLREKYSAIPYSLVFMFFKSYLISRVRDHYNNKIKFKEQWMIYYRFGNDLSFNIRRFQSIVSNKDRFIADPFLYKKDNKYFIFVEELKYSEGKGYISVIEINDNNHPAPKPVPVLRENFHLSFPFLIEEQDDLYMIPESKEDNSIKLYKCIKFPSVWKFYKNIMSDIKAVDTIVFKYQSKYWLFTTTSKYKGASYLDELHIYFSDDLLEGIWTAHPKNPVVSDVKKARNAGNIFYNKGMMCRPSQNCSKRYGYGIQINEILTLNEFEYEERIIDSIFPDGNDNLLGMHTINSLEGLTVIDGLRKRKIYNI